MTALDVATAAHVVATAAQIAAIVAIHSEDMGLSPFSSPRPILVIRGGDLRRS
jgi:hypothetical protein